MSNKVQQLQSNNIFSKCVNLPVSWQLIAVVYTGSGSSARECADVNKMHTVKSLSDLATRPHTAGLNTSTL